MNAYQKILKFLRTYKRFPFMIVGTTASRILILEELLIDIGKSDVDIILKLPDESWKWDLKMFMKDMENETGLGFSYDKPCGVTFVKHRGEDVMTIILDTRQDDPDTDKEYVNGYPILKRERILALFSGSYEDTLTERNVESCIRYSSTITCLKIMGVKPHDYPPYPGSNPYE